MSHPIAMIKVKLPSPSGFHSSPSGDTEYQEAWGKAMAAAMPAGYGYTNPRFNEKWPVDSNGLTWVPIYCLNRDDALENCHKRIKKLEAIIDGIRKLLPDELEAA